jgi:hypothetical protein
VTVKLLNWFFSCIFLIGSVSAAANTSQPICSQNARYLDQCLGKRQYANDIAYSGAFSKDQPEGIGVMTWGDGVSFVGVFSSGHPTVNGVYKDRSGALVTSLDRRSIELIRVGKLEFASGNSYEGEYRNMKPHGKGTYFYRDGTKFIGIFVEGVRTGKGVEYDRIGAISRSGDWKLDELIRSDVKVVENTNILPIQQISSLSTNTNKPVIYANRRALVIGNDSYKSVAKLINAREDARTIASNLTSVGYQVTLMVDLNEKEMKAAIRTFAGQVQGGDEIMFFFAGHGVQLGSTNYLLPIDILGENEGQVRDEAIQLQRVLDDMAEKKAKFTLAMIDACRDNPFKTTGRAIGGRGLSPTTAATGQMIIFSAGTGQQALDRLNITDKNKNGLFTRVFVQEMQKSNVSIDRVVKNVRNQVAELAKSVGHEQVPAIYDQVLGDFYFKK